MYMFDKFAKEWATRVCDDQKPPKKIPICMNGDALLVSSLDFHLLRCEVYMK